MMTNPWFGIADVKNTLFMSVISLYDHILNEQEISELPLMINEYDNDERALIEESYNNFFNENIYGCCKILWDDNSFYNSKEFTIISELNNFLNEKSYPEYIDLNRSVIYKCSFDLNILVYSINEINFKLASRLYFPIINECVSWADTTWGDNNLELR